jgi:pimeloyl-ACP methyl ester carboxylesterase
MGIRHWAWVALLLAVPAPGEAGPAAWIQVAGATAERVQSRVFDGHLMLYRAGNRDGEAVLLVHGLGQNGARDWARVIPALAPQYDVYALDLPGFGASSKGNQLYSPENYVREIELAVAPRIGKPFHLVGHSMGAAIAMAYASAHPQRVTRLTLADMAGMLLGPVYAQSLAKFGIEQQTGLPEDAPMFDRLLRWTIKQVDNQAFSSEMILRTPWLRERMLRGDPNLIAAFALGEHDFSRALRQVPMPTLLIWGSEDRVAPMRTAQLAAALIPGARLELVPGAAHVPMAEAPARFNALLLEHLGGRAPAAAAMPRGGPIVGKEERCGGRAGAVYSGDIPKLTLTKCNGVQVSGARIGELRVVQSEVELLNTDITGGIDATHSRVRLTGGSVAGAPALRLDAADIDAAGTRFEPHGELVENAGPVPVALWFSVAELRRAGVTTYLHESLRVEPRADAVP